MSRGFVKDGDQEEVPMVTPRPYLPNGSNNYVTREGYEALQNERKELVAARESISGNETDSRVERNYINAKLKLLEERINSAQFVDSKMIKTDEVCFGAWVCLKMNNNKKATTIHITGADEANPLKGYISYFSPLANSISGHKVGDVVEAEIPSGKCTIKILSISYTAPESVVVNNCEADKTNYVELSAQSDPAINNCEADKTNYVELSAQSDPAVENCEVDKTHSLCEKPLAESASCNSSQCEKPLAESASSDRSQCENPLAENASCNSSQCEKPLADSASCNSSQCERLNSESKPTDDEGFHHDNRDETSLRDAAKNPITEPETSEAHSNAQTSNSPSGTISPAPQATAIQKDNEQEILPVVNERGLTVGHAPRWQCHNGSKLLHPVVHLHVFNSKGELYLQQRPLWKKIQPGKWDTAVGGHVSFGESIENALKRETLEELGISDYTPTRLKTYIFESDCEKELINPFRTIYDGIITPSQELSDGRFWSIDEIRQNIGKNVFTPNFEMEFKRLNLH